MFFFKMIREAGKRYRRLREEDLIVDQWIIRVEIGINVRNGYKPFLFVYEDGITLKTKGSEGFYVSSDSGTVFFLKKKKMIEGENSGSVTTRYLIAEI